MSDATREPAREAGSSVSPARPGPVLREIVCKSLLTKTGIGGYDYCINPFVGCAHGCTYCYAGFMKRFTGHTEPWGSFVDVKVNGPEVLAGQLRRRRKGTVLIGTVTDPYQPAEREHGVTRRCLETLLEGQWPVHLLTRSPLCTRDIDLFRHFTEISVGLSVTTDDDSVRKTFEPFAPPIPARIRALGQLKRAGISTYAFIGPLLPMSPERLVEALGDSVDEVMIDRMNYAGKVVGLYRRQGLSQYLTGDYFISTARNLKGLLEHRGVPASIIF